jgi:hypothetical protein
LLTAFFDWRHDGQLPSPNERHGQPSSKPKNEMGDVHAMMCDVSRVYDRLDEEAQAILEAVSDAPSDPYDALAELLGVLPKSAEQRYRRIVTRITRQLNQLRERAEYEYVGVGGRHAISNARAQATTGNPTRR